MVARGVTPGRNRVRRSFVVGCMKRFVIAASLLALSCGGSAESSPPPATNGVAVLELFTSQGCSSCPPADALLSRLDGDPALRGRVIPLAFHVDYWNHIGWSDPFSSREWSERQRDYSRALRGDVYTPQLVVNGSRGMVGSSERAVREAIAAAIAEEPAARIRIAATVTADRTIAIDVTGVVSGRREAEVWIAIVEDGLVTRVARGENGGRTLRNNHVVRALRHASTLHPDGDGAGHIELLADRAWNLEKLEVVAFAQDVNTSRIVGATATRLPIP